MKLPQTVTLILHIHAQEGYDGTPRIKLFDGDRSEYGYIYLGETTITLDIPQIDIVAAQIALIEKVKAEVVKEYETKLHDLDEKLQNLRALGYIPLPVGDDLPF